MSQADTNLSLKKEKGRLDWVNLRLAAAGIDWRVLFTGAALLIAFIAGLAAIQFASPNLAGNDGYFHIKFAQVMRQQGLRPHFPWLPLTILNAANFYDHHFLYHVLLIPFTLGDNLLAGAKWAAVLFAALSFLTGWLLLRGQRVPYAAVWALGFLAVSHAFLYRLSMTRVQSLSLLMLMFILHVSLTRQYRWLLPLAFVYIWLYDAFVLVLMVVGGYVVARWLIERQLKPAPAIYAGLGLGLGLLINPYFPNNLIFIYHHLLPKILDTTAIGVGGEWYPYDTWDLVENSALALLAFVAGAFALGWHERRMDTRSATLFLLALGFGLILFKSRRFIEYFPAFALLFCAVAWAPIIEAWRQQGRRAARVLPLGLALVFAAGSADNILHLRQELQESTPYQRYAGASAWLQANTPPGSRIFQTDWDDFTWLYFYNTQNSYTVGLDPTYMQLYNAGLYDLWREIANGRVEPPSPAIVENFEAGYVLTDLEHVRFLYVARADPDMAEVYRDEYAVIYKILSYSPN